MLLQFQTKYNNIHLDSNINYKQNLNLMRMDVRNGQKKEATEKQSETEKEELTMTASRIEERMIHQ